ncbi:MAG: SDR family NAD(P)-dependent oxidoreductase [Cyclobacteriaceae bacterium]|nr:SDR family NAD(P)-dependent oxidoreductase [Cyclobacteriaceae bacterium]
MSLQSFYSDKVVLITGASMGIGKELARQVLVAGGKAVITGRNVSRLQAVQREFESYADHLIIHAGDVADYKDNQVLVEKIIAQFGKLDVLINNAGISCFGEVEVLQEDVVRQVVDTNIYGSVFPVMAALPELKKTKGSILFVSSVAGFHGLPGHSTYSLSKMSLKALAQSLRTELLQHGVFAGIAYVGFTENETDKRTISPNGNPEPVPQRPKRLVASREETAVKILNQIRNRKAEEIHGWLGKFTGVMSRLFPSLLHLLIRKNYKKR